MPETKKKAVKQVYDEGMAEVFKIVGSLEATQQQRRTALQTARDLSALLIAHTLETIAGRTALLAGLIVELNEVIDSVQTKPPYADAINNLAGILTRTKDLFVAEKTKLV